MLLPGGITNIFAGSGVLEGFDIKKIRKGLDGLSISEYIAFSDISVCLHFHEFPFLGMFNAI